MENQNKIEEIIGVLQTSILENCEKMVKEVDPDLPLLEYIKNSIEFVKIIVDIEETYGMTFANEELDISRFKNVRDWAHLIAEKLA